MKSLIAALLVVGAFSSVSARADLGKPEYRLKDANLELCQETQRIIKQSTRLASDYFLADQQEKSAALTKARDAVLSAYNADMGCPALIREYQEWENALRATCDALEARYEASKNKVEGDPIRSAQLLLKLFDDKKAAGCNQLPARQ